MHENDNIGIVDPLERKGEGRDKVDILFIEKGSGC